MINEAIRCIDVVEAITEWMEGALDERTRSDIEEHLIVCAPCSAFAGQLRKVGAALSSLDPDVPAPLRGRLLQSFAKWADGSGASPTASRRDEQPPS
ncbi:MAG: zf-HC2 domain-containing protein [Acidobacteriota bacterium]|nr:zf-HC2 domain-containing protein [Acidobacteriota bacterium]